MIGAIPDIFLQEIPEQPKVETKPSPRGEGLGGVVVKSGFEKAVNMSFRYTRVDVEIKTAT